MTPAQLAVTALGVAAIAWSYWSDWRERRRNASFRRSTTAHLNLLTRRVRDLEKR